MFEAAAAASQQPGGGAVPSTGGANPAAAGGGGVGTNSLDFLRENPQFQMLRQLLQEQPNLINPILQQLGQGNPQLAQLIASHPDAFMSLLAEGSEEGALPTGGEQQLEVTADERDAIARLEALGFPRDIVIQAYFACEKNEELAGMLFT